MTTEKAFKNLRLAIYTPMVFGVIFLALDFISQSTDALPDFNRLFSIMTPMQTAGGLLLFLGINTYSYFVAYKKSLPRQK